MSSMNASIDAGAWQQAMQENRSTMRLSVLEQSTMINPMAMQAEETEHDDGDHKAKYFSKFTKDEMGGGSDDGEAKETPLSSASSWRKIKSDISGRLIPGCVDMLKALWALEEPELTGLFAVIVRHRWFERTLQLVILANCLFMLFAANYEMSNPYNPSTVIPLIDILFQVLYTCELVMKLSVHRWFFFWNHEAGLNAFDLFLVLSGFVDLLFSSGSSGSVALRTIRILKLGKALRALKVIAGFKELRAILICIQGSFVTLLWSVLMLCIVFYMFSLIFVQQAASLLKEVGDRNDAEVGGLFESFANVQQGMLTLSMAAFGGQDWGDSYKLVSHCGWMSSAFFLLFVAFSQIALINIITGIFVDNAMQNLSPDKETQAKDLHAEESSLSEELVRLCIEVDDDQSGCLTKEQFANGIQRGRIPMLLNLLGLNKRHVQRLFELLCEGSEDQQVDIVSFVHACMRLRGAATSFDLQVLTTDMQGVQKQMARQFRALNRRFNTLELGMGVALSPSNTAFGAVSGPLEKSYERSPSADSLDPV